MKLPAKHSVLTLLSIAIACAAAQAQCYTDPITGQRICTRQVLPCQLATETTTVDSTAHCRITVADGTMGSGTLVATNDTVGLVLTCSHLFNSSKSNIIVTFPSGRRFAANLAELDRANDLAALTIRRSDLAPLAVSETEPTGVLTACGFGPNGIFRSIAGRKHGVNTWDWIMRRSRKILQFILANVVTEQNGRWPKILVEVFSEVAIVTP